MSDVEEKSNKGAGEDAIPTASVTGVSGVAGGQVGVYKLLRMLGEGGFAEVYLAEQQKPVKRRVALKVIKPGMDSKQVIARFEAERQALALLDHPNIAQVYDAGTTEAGRPYFVMEYVRGVSLTEHCDGEKLSIEQRLELFVQVCEAVQHAHQKGIIHRDIKPSNVLVSIEGEHALPKIIDFGVAKAITQPLTERTLFTEQGQMIGTPEYMSPEQAGMTNQDIDTRSDIYSLGVLLYELLTGLLPFDRKTLEQAAFAEIQRIIREEDPPRPSTRLSSLGEEATKFAKSRRTEVAALAKRLHRELEWIPLKAMRKERMHRYRSATELADDIQNYLNGVPLIAGPESAVYRVKKFVRRNRAFVIGITAVVFSLSLGIIVSTFFALGQSRSRKDLVVALNTAEEARMKAEDAENIAQYERKKKEEEAIRAHEAQEMAEREAYCATIQNIWAKLKAKDHYGTRKMLEETDPSLRGWEWGYLKRMCQYPDWTLQTSIIYRYRVSSFAVSPDNNYFLTYDDNSLILWDRNTQERVWSCSYDNPLRQHQFLFEPKGSFIVAMFSNNIFLCDIKTGEIIHQYSDVGCLNRICIHPEKPKIYVSTNDGRLLVLNTKDLSLDKTLKFKISHNSCLLAIGAKGKFLLINIGGHHVYLMDTSSLEILHEFRSRTGEGIKDLAIVENHDVILLADGGDVVDIYSLDFSERMKSLTGYTNNVCSIRASADEKRVIIGSLDGTAHIYDTSNWKLNGIIYHDSGVLDSAYLKDGKIITCGVHGTIKQWSTLDIPQVDPAISFQTGRVGGGFYKLEYRSDGRKIAISGWSCSTIPLLDVHAKQIDYLNVKNFEKATREKRTMWFRPNSYELAVQTPGWLRFHDTEEKDYPEVRKICLPENINDACFDSTGQFLAISYINGDLALIDVISGQSHKIQLSYNDMKTAKVSFSEDGKMLAILERWQPGRLILWDVVNSQITWETQTTCDGNRGYIAFHPSGDIIAVASGSIIRVWDIKSGDCIKTLFGHDYNVACVQFSPDGTRLVSGAADGDRTMRLWDWKLGKELIRFKQCYYAIDAKFSPDGLSIANTNLYPDSAWIRTALPWTNLE